MCNTAWRYAYHACTQHAQHTNRNRSHSLVRDCTTYRAAASSKSYTRPGDKDCIILGTMTVVYHSVLRLLLLLIPMATITLGTQPVRGDGSEGESTSTRGCISDWMGLKKAYLERQSSADVENSIFDFHPSDAINYGVLVMFYDMGPPPNTSTSGKRDCCQRGSKDCFIYFIYRHTVFSDIHPRLFYSRVGDTFSTFSSYRTHQLCWAPPPLCNAPCSKAMLHEFSTQVRTYIIILFNCSCGLFIYCTCSIYTHIWC